MSRNTIYLMQKTTCKRILIRLKVLKIICQVSYFAILPLLDLCCTGQQMPLIGCRKVYTVCTPNRYTGVLDLQKCRQYTPFWILRRALCVGRL